MINVQLKKLILTSITTFEQIYYLLSRGVAQLVERYIRDVEAARSNRVTPINFS